MRLTITWWRTLEEPRVLPDAAAVTLQPAPAARPAGLVLIAVTVALDLVFWQNVVPRIASRRRAPAGPVTSASPPSALG